MRLLVLALVIAASGQAPPYEASVVRLTRAELGASWRPGCPMAPSRLRRVRLVHWGFDGQVHRGELVVDARVAAAVGRVFGRLYAARFPIRRMRPISAYGADDERSMRADNTSAFNCRYAIASGAGRRTRTARRSTSIRSRTRTWRAAASTRRPGAPSSTARTGGPG